MYGPKDSTSQTFQLKSLHFDIIFYVNFQVQKTIAMKGDSKIYIAVSKVEFCNEGRLGNKMFQAAAGLSIAHKNNATFALVKG